MAALFIIFSNSPNGYHATAPEAAKEYSQAKLPQRLVDLKQWRLTERAIA